MIKKLQRKRIGVALMSLGVALAAGMSFGTGGGGGGCWSDYYHDQISVCYYSGTDGANGTFLAAEWDDPSGAKFTPPYPRLWAINREWATGEEIAGGEQNNISGVWKGSFDFQGGRHLFTVFANDGVRLYIDEELVLDRWLDVGETQFFDDPPARWAVARELSAGRHLIRVDWYNRTGDAQVRLHWDKGPSAQQTSWPVVVDAFIVKQQDLCIAGEEAAGPGPTAATIYEPGGAAFKSWKIQADQPLIVKKSQEAEMRAQYPLVYCFSFGFTPAEVQDVYADLAQFESWVENWSFGALDVQLEIAELSGEILITRAGDTFWVNKEVLEAPTKGLVTSDTDFTLSLPSNTDIGSTNPDGSSNAGRYFEGFGCGRIEGVDDGLWGTGHSWISQGCRDPGVIVSEWGHQLRCVIRCLLGFPSGESFDTDAPGTFPTDAGTFPPCGQGNPDPFSWYTPHYEYWRDPAGPWCGWPFSTPDPKALLPQHPDKTLQLAANIMWHFDPSLGQYELDFFTGNHCNDLRLNFGEDSVDAGGNCPIAGQPPTLALGSLPLDGTWITGSLGITATTEPWAKEVRLLVDGQVVQVDSAAPFTFTLNTQSFAEASLHQISVVAVDWEGLSDSETFTVGMTNADTDGDAFLDGFEVHMGTDPASSCGVDAWPLDFNNNETVDDGDVGLIQQHMNTTIGAPGYEPRYDLNADGRINIFDLTAFAGKLGTLCSVASNGSFEQGSYDPAGAPTGWGTNAWNPAGADFTWDDSTSMSGTKSVKIEATTANDAYWVRAYNVQPGADYVLSGWIRTENVSGGAGAQLGIFGRWEHSPSIYGTQDWTYVEFAFNAGSDSVVEIAARLGHWSATATGTVWFDYLRLTEVN